MQVDTEVSYNVLPRRYWLTTTQIGRTKRELVTYSKSKLSALGTATEFVGNPRNYVEYTVKFVVVEDGFTPLLVAAATHKIDFKVVVVQHQNILPSGSVISNGPS